MSQLARATAALETGRRSIHPGETTMPEMYPFCCHTCGVVEVSDHAPAGWVYSEVVDAGPLPDYSYWLCERCAYE